MSHVAHFSLKEVTFFWSEFDSTALLFLQDFPHILHMEVKVPTEDQNIIKVRHTPHLSGLQGSPPCVSEKQPEHLSAQRAS